MPHNEQQSLRLLRRTVSCCPLLSSHRSPDNKQQPSRLLLRTGVPSPPPPHIAPSHTMSSSHRSCCFLYRVPLPHPLVTSLAQ
ncbi:hypothetical protein CVT25_004858 [Psilocybe cyanescens]|uniref:Uncharacterized protein n=1 Tax=Psilocybe cyanescens TaxID=93625 RepID=A0A409VY28_PSICY|nr:hypothetical protein CVT25_004858 [Psilocybe cyanescens]